MSIAMPADSPTRPLSASGRLREANLSSESCQMGQWMHLSFLIGLLVTGAVVFPLFIAAPLVFWLVKRESSGFVDDHGREAVNFGISYLLISLLFIWTGIIPLIMLVVAFVGSIRGAMAASRGEYYRYPMTIRFIK